jgi:hypothetical protein
MCINKKTRLFIKNYLRLFNIFKHVFFSRFLTKKNYYFNILIRILNPYKSDLLMFFKVRLLNHVITKISMFQKYY